MDKNLRKGQICGLISTGIHLEGLLRVALERPALSSELEEELRDTFNRLTVVFNNLFPPKAEPSEVPSESVAEIEIKAVEPDNVSVAESVEEETGEEPESLEIEIEGTKVEIPERPLSEALKVDELIARKESADLRKAFTLNDKFRFRRTIFGGSDQQFVHTLEALEKLSRFEDALSLLSEILPDDGEDNEDFLNIVKQHFDSKQ